MLKRSDDPRLSELFRDHSNLDNNCRTIALIRFPSDEGVRRNGGRPGACEGPSVVMEVLPRLGCLHNREFDINLQNSNVQLLDYGAADEGELEIAHSSLHTLVSNCLRSKFFPLSIGGGNDQSWANGSAWIDWLRSLPRDNATLQRKLAVINVDAHLDVRPLIPSKDGTLFAHSGSPFRQLIEMARATEDLLLIEFAAQGQQCSSAHVDYVLNNGGRIIWLSQLRGVSHVGHECQMCKSQAARDLHKILTECEETERRVFFSFDIDAIRAADCPGVSCPSPIGLSSEEALELCFLAGLSHSVDLMDISEFNPRIEASQTSRLVANMIYYFTMGYSQRKHLP